MPGRPGRPCEEGRKHKEEGIRKKKGYDRLNVYYWFEKNHIMRLTKECTYTI